MPQQETFSNVQPIQQETFSNVAPIAGVAQAGASPASWRQPKDPFSGQPFGSPVPPEMADAIEKSNRLQGRGGQMQNLVTTPVSNAVGAVDIATAIPEVGPKLVSKLIPSALKNPATEVQQGIANIAKETGSAAGKIKPTAGDPYGFRQVADEQIGRYKGAAQKLDELSGNAFSDAQQEVADARDDFTAAGKKAYREAQAKLDGVIDKFRPELEKAGMAVDSMKADYRAAMANNKIAAFLNKTTEETGSSVPEATAKLGPGLKEAFLDLVQNQKNLLDRAGWTDEQVNQAITWARKLSTTAENITTAKKVAGGVAGGAVGSGILLEALKHYAPKSIGP